MRDADDFVGCSISFCDAVHDTFYSLRKGVNICHVVMHSSLVHVLYQIFDCYVASVLCKVEHFQPTSLLIDSTTS